VVTRFKKEEIRREHQTVWKEGRLNLLLRARSASSQVFARFTMERRASAISCSIVKHSDCKDLSCSSISDMLSGGSGGFRFQRWCAPVLRSPRSRQLLPEAPEKKLLHHPTVAHDALGLAARFLNDPDGHEISLYWAGENRMKKTVMEAARKVART
jgi:hypothetical protein